MGDAKNFLTSKTLWGAFIMLLPLVGEWFGLTITKADAKEITELVEGLIQTAGAFVVVWGRVTATKPIKIK